MSEERTILIPSPGSRLVCGCPMCHTAKGFEIGCRNCEGRGETYWIAATLADLRKRTLTGSTTLYPFKSLKTGQICFVDRTQFLSEND